jgi:hypothetical protein
VLPSLLYLLGVTGVLLELRFSTITRIVAALEMLPVPVAKTAAKQAIGQSVFLILIDVSSCQGRLEKAQSNEELSTPQSAPLVVYHLAR